MVFRGQSDFIDQGPEAYLEWGRHFGRFVEYYTPKLHLLLSIIPDLSQVISTV
jgi:hypothetical protein